MRIPRDKELKIIAMLARGDLQKDIAKSMEVSEGTITYIKKHQSEALNMLQSRIQDKSQELVVLNHTSALEELSRRLSSTSELIKTGELVAITKEMFSEKQLMEGKPTQINNYAGNQIPVTNQQNLRALVDAIEQGDEVVMSQIVFNPTHVIESTI